MSPRVAADPRRPGPPFSAVRWGLAVTAAATAFVTSYAGQRLWSLASEPDPSQAVSLGHTPLYWRCGVALLHAAIAASMLGTALDDERATAILRWAPLWLPATVIPLALLMGVYP